MEEPYQYLGSSALTDQQRLNGDIEVVDIRRSEQSEAQLIETYPLHTQNIRNWLAAHPTAHDTRAPSSFPLARIVLVDKDSRTPCDGGPTASQIVDTFGLRLAYDYANSCVTGVTVLPPPAKSCPCTSAYMAAHPKLVAIWSASGPPSPLQALHHRNHCDIDHTASATFPLQAVIFASPCERARLKGLLSRPWDLALTSHSMFPAFLCGLAISQEVDKTQESINEAMRHVEARTGHHYSVRRHDEPAQGSWGHLSAKMSGFARKLASTSRKIQTATDLQTFMLTHAADKEPDSEPSERAAQLIRHHAGLMCNRLEMQRRQNEFLNQKVNIQLTAVSSASLPISPFVTIASLTRLLI